MTDTIGQQISTGTTPTLLVPPLPSSQVVVFHNKGSASIFIGDSAVTTSGAHAGVEVAAGEVFPQGVMEIPPETSVYGVVTTATQRMDVFRIVAD